MRPDAEPMKGMRCAWSLQEAGRLTVMKVVGFADVDTDECHELELRQPLPRRRGQRQQVAQVRDL